MTGYLALLRQNKNFRRLWYGQVVSQLGDWLDSIALFTLMLSLTGSGQAVGLLLLAEFLPGALVGPFAGVIVDRLPRKLVLIGADLGRAAMVLLLLLVNGPEDLWLVYTAVIAKVSMAAFFEPARSAILPSICSREELVAANAISGATWSAMLAIGAALGGLVAGTLGVAAAFALDAATFVLSALLIATVRVGERDQEPKTNDQSQPQRADDAPAQRGRSGPDPGTAGSADDGRATTNQSSRPRLSGLRPASVEDDGRATADQSSRPRLSGLRPWSLVFGLVSELREGLRYVLERHELLWLTFSKAIWSLGGGVLLLLALYGREIFPLGRDGALSIGLLYAARGIGTGIGPFLALRVSGSGQAQLRRWVAAAFFISGTGYILLSGAPTLALAALAVLFAHIGGSIQWVFSTALIQGRVPDRLLGRVFATEYAALTLTTALSAYFTGLARDAGAPPWVLAIGLGCIFLAAGAVMVAALWRTRELPETSALG